jgi:three-Cys-motif partner protein
MASADPYAGREQSLAKHFILRRYLQALAFKVLRGWDITYVDGFSGPWESRTPDFSDTSFMIAIDVLKDAQEQIFAQTGRHRHIRCFFSEKMPRTYEQLARAVKSHHDPARAFEIETHCGEFEGAVDKIQRFIGASFPLIFIDPTGWTGYPFDKIRSLFLRPKVEVLINFMYDHVSRFVASHDESIVGSLDPILGGPGWRTRLDTSLPLGPAVEKLFRETLRIAGDFEHVVSTKIDKPAADRPYFFLAYATKDRVGLKTFRQIEYDALRRHAKNRAGAKEKLREERSGTGELFAGHDAQVQEASIDEIVAEQKARATQNLLKILTTGRALQFEDIVARLLEPYMLRETDVKDICVDLARDGRIRNTWGGGNRKPQDADLIELTTE